MKFTSGRLGAIGSWIKRRFRQGFLGTGNLLLWASLLSLLCVALAVALSDKKWLTANELDDKLRIEFVHFLLQVPLVVVLGAAANLISGLYQARKQKRESDEQFLLDVRKQLVEAYSDVKQARRLLKTRGLVRVARQPTQVRVSVYDAQMEAISLARLRLESLSHRIRGWSEARKTLQGATVVVYSIEQMEEYLAKLNLEWEYAISGVSCDQTEIAVTELPILMPALLHSEEGGTFRSDFRDDYRTAIWVLSSVHPGDD